MSSNWNRWMNRVIAEDLTAGGYRLALVLARAILGFRKTEERLGRQFLRDEGRFHGKSLERARDELVEKGLLHYEPGKPGRGHRSLYRLILDPEEKAALERPFSIPEKATLERHLPSAEKAALMGHFPGGEKAAEKAALERPRIEKREEIDGGVERVPSEDRESLDGDRASTSDEDPAREDGSHTTEDPSPLDPLTELRKLKARYAA